MTTNELKEYIRHYLEEDASHSAILLNAPWGSGKSYFIRNELVPYLNENGKDRCIVVSLYGLKDLSEISKCIYFESRTEGFKVKDSTKLVGKTVVRGVASGISVPVSVSDKDLQKLYESISLSGKLIIFEDVERSSIDILEFMGYVNSLVELDNGKVLLVSNEREILHEKGTETVVNANGTESVKIIYTDAAEKYLRIKEKTVSDTLQYEGDLASSLASIIKNFSSKRLLKFAEKEAIKELVDILNENEEKNLRSFIFACQKTEDLFNVIDKNVDDEFLREIYYSNVIFSMNLKRGQSSEWKGKSLVCYELGSERYPMYRFAYDYILSQNFPTKEVLSESYKTYKKVSLYNEYKSVKDEDLETLFNFMTKKEIEVRVALKGLEMKLQDENRISFIEYGKIASVLVCLHESLGYDIEVCKERLLKNLEGKSDRVDDYLLFTNAFKPITKDGKKEFADLKKKIVAILNPDASATLVFDYTVEAIADLYEQVKAKKAKLQQEGKFFVRFHIDSLTRTVFLCSAEQINTLRNIFREVYGKSCFEEDRELLKAFAVALKNGTSVGFDKIQTLQVNLLISELNDYLKKN